MQRYFLSFLLLLATFLLQKVVVPYIRIFDVEPDLILVATICFALSGGLVYGSTTGFLGGFLEDLLLAKYMGFNMLTKTIIGALAGIVKDYTLPGGILFPLIAVFIGSILSQFMFGILFFLFGETFIFQSIFNWRLLLTGLYNVLFTPFIFPVVYHLLKWERKI